MTARTASSRPDDRPRQRGLLAFGAALCAAAVAGLSPTAATTAHEAAPADEPTSGVQIVGGGPADEGEYPFVVALLRAGVPGGGFERHFCGGTLVAPEWVLTAAHCFVSPIFDGGRAGVDDVEVVVGRTRLSSTSGESRRPAELIIHPSATGRAADGSDVALVRLATPSTKPPIALAAAADRSLWEPGDVATTAGWGLADDGHPSDALLEVDVPVQPDAVTSVYPDFDPAEMVGAGGPSAGGRDSCKLDSGGPLLVRSPSGPRQVGVVSFGRFPCGQSTHPGVYAKVAEGPLRTWLELNAQSFGVFDASVTEGDSGTTNLRFGVSVRRAFGQARPASVRISTEDGSARAGSDYEARSGGVSFRSGESARFVVVPVVGDRSDEPTEALTVRLSSPVNGTIFDATATGTIADQDPAPGVTPGDTSTPEGYESVEPPCAPVCAYPADATVAVRLGQPSAFPVRVAYATADGTATTADYQATKGTLTFAPGETSKLVRVPVRRDSVREPTETFFVNLSAPSNATIVDGQAKVAIVDGVERFEVFN